MPRVLDTLDEALREVRGERAPTLVDIARARGLLPDAVNDVEETSNDSE